MVVVLSSVKDGSAPGNRAISFFLCAITDVADQETVKCLVGIAFSFQHNLQIVLPVLISP